MAYNNGQSEYPVPTGDGDSGKRESARHLPKYFRTDKNKKFLQSTLDQILQPGVAEKVNSYVGRKSAKAYNLSDNYLPEVSKDREDYQLEPVSVIEDLIGNVDFYADYRDYINQIKAQGGTADNHGRNNKEEFYAWDPHIDWDKFSNFREYYWLANGPRSVIIPGESKEITSTYTVKLAEALGDYSYVFTPDGLTNNPNLKLYRGVKYRFEIDTPGVPLTFRTARVLDDEFLLNDGISQQEVEQGVIELELGRDAPDELYYVSSNDVNIGGFIKVANVEDATFIDVEAEILGKKSYTSRDGWTVSNGLKVRFQGEVIPEKYSDSEWYVEGVGDAIVLVSGRDVEVSFPVGIDVDVPFDADEGFDNFPFSEATGYPRDKDYITINRSSTDGNFWSRYNRWFHKDVIELADSINKSVTLLDQTTRANRPIIEFDPGIKLYNFGTSSKGIVDLIDDYTTDVFSTIEGSLGYNIDGIQVSQGMRILFLADPDPLVTGKIFEVNFLQFRGSGTGGQIQLIEVADSDPIAGENILVTRGEQYGGKIWYYDGTVWNLAQEKVSVNQPPIFDVFDVDDVSFSNTSKYPASSFRGTKLFSYKENSLTTDSELGFGLSYRSIENVGDIVFDFNYNTDTFQYQIGDTIIDTNINTGFLRKYNSNNQFEVKGVYVKSDRLSEQAVVLQYVNDETRLTYPINCFNQSAYLDDLNVIVYVDNVRQYDGIDYECIDTADKLKNVKFLKDIDVNAVIILKCFSSAIKNNNGYYEIANNLERNPLNEDISTFTLGEVSDHVLSITENASEFSGVFPGPSNLRDISKLSTYGRKFIKHSAPLNLSIYSLLDKSSNAPNAVRYARKEYSKFKRVFLETAESLGYEGPVRQHVDKIISEITKDKTNTMPFYQSDMIPFGASITTKITVEDADARFFALNTPFTLSKLSTNAVTVYINGSQLIHERDYVFNEEGFLEITVEKNFGDIIEINEYDTTNGSYIPPTPTKLGLYPAYEPVIYVDDSYQPAVTLIKGHDGSIVRAFGDFRDNLIIELEKRIFNNIKIKYDTSEINIHSFLPGLSRNTAFSRLEVDKTMTPDFIQWLSLVDQDYTEHAFFDRSNNFSYNYSSLSDKNGEKLPGWWRGIYRYYYDTITPHLTPWEMLGFSIEPKWWKEQYGPAPYTKNNNLLWEDLEKGIIREPGKGFVINKLYARPGLSTFIPVDAQGNILAPSECNIPLRFTFNNITSGFKFGDSAPVEDAWRSSSEYPFSVITSWLINNPSTLLSSGFDRSRQKRNILGQFVYTETNRHIRLQDLVFPSNINSSQKVFTSGLINYIQSYMSYNLTESFDTYQSNLKSIKNKLAFKLGGYSDKEKFKLILDSRTPLNQGNVFIPEENYKLFLNTSYAINTVTYSGVIIEKTLGGFSIRGYDSLFPAFKYFEPYTSTGDVTVNVGGVSETFASWTENKTYVKDLIVEYNGSFYRTLRTVTSSEEFDPNDFVKLSRLPVTGGIDATFKTKFEKSQILQLPYGSILPTIQDVVDFLLGYEEWLKVQGFRFEHFDGKEVIISDWKNSAREFMFWTMHNWGDNAIISLSPAADQIWFETEYSVVDNVIDNFYGYGIFKASGKPLDTSKLNFDRIDVNKFKITPNSSSDGVYAIKLPVVQKEHIVLIDNSTVFGDVVYQPSTGYRQERIKTFGYRTSGWDGSLNIPGFIYTEVTIKEWESWKDYDIGSIVKYKEFYYSANSKISGKETFTFNDWTRISDVPESTLKPNFEYKINQFADFYDLDTDNFDTEQQQLAQHLIGYQKRSYLENIINDEVSQYKFYQGMIKEKGTKNSLDKLFDVLSADDKESLDFYEEWAIKQGQYGASEGFDEVEFTLDERKFRINPQPIKLSNSDEDEGLIYKIKDYEVYKKPDNYSNNLFPLLEDYKQFTRSPGFMNIEDVKELVPDYDSLLTLNIDNLNNLDYVWTGSDNNKWDVLQYGIGNEQIVSLKTSPEKSPNTPDLFEIELTLTSVAEDVNIGDVIGIFNIQVPKDLNEDSTKINTTNTELNSLKGFFKVTGKYLNKLYVGSSTQLDAIPECTGLMSKFSSVKVADYLEANQLTQKGVKNESLVWIQNNDQNWKVLKNTQAYSLLQTIPAEEEGTTNEFGKTITVDNRNSLLSVASPSSGISGKLFIYNRGGNNQNFQFAQIIEPSTSGVSDPGNSFGSGQSFSKDGKYLVVGAPKASNIKTRYQGFFDEAANYDNGDIVQYGGQLWEVVVDILGAQDEQEFGSFGSNIEVLQSNNVFQNEAFFRNILLGDYPFDGDEIETDHILIRASFDQYEATGPGDTVFFDWYAITTANQFDPLSPRVPFQTDDMPLGYTQEGLTEAYLESGLVIRGKADVILYTPIISTVPQVGDQIESTGVFGYVSYVRVDEARATIYVERTSGIWPAADNLFLESGEFVGAYVRQAPNDTIDVSDQLGGYWYFDLPNPILLTENNVDEGRALAVYNIIPSGKTDPGGAGGNIWDLNNTVTNIGDNSINSYIRTLTYQGSPGPAGNLDIIPSDLFVVRASKDLTDNLTPGDEIGLEVIRFPDFTNNNEFIDLTVTGLEYTDTNKKHILYDLWDGYIDFDLDETDSNTGQPFEPRIGQFVRERTPNPGATAKVAFYQKFNNSRARVYVTNVQGTWGIGNDGRTLEMIGDPQDPNPIYAVDQDLGDIRATALGSDTLGIGKLCVIQLPAEIETVPVQSTLIGAEYLIYRDFPIFGLPREANIPGSTNLDYKQVFKIPVNPDGPSTNVNNLGYYAIYERENVSTFNIVDTLIVPELVEDLNVGSQIKIAKRNDLYKAFIKAEGNGTISNPGRIYFVNKGTDDEGIVYDWEYAKDKRYKGVFSDQNEYLLDDYVYYEGYFYKALTNIAGDGTAFVTTEWELINNDQIRSIDYLGYIPNDTSILPEDFDYKGLFDSNSTYIVDEIVQYLDGNFYKALRNIPLNYNGFVDVEGIIEYPAEDWEQISFTPGGDQSLKIDTTLLRNFAEKFDVSDNGEVLVATAEYEYNADPWEANTDYQVGVRVKYNNDFYECIVEVDGSLPVHATFSATNIVNFWKKLPIIKKVIVYRNVNDNYQKSQELIAPIVDENMEFGVTLSISQDGKMIAVGAPGADVNNELDIGAVFVYKQVNGTFELSQTLTSTNQIQGEQFGRNIDFDGFTLYVSAFNASSDDNTTFDLESTVFDNKFTTFKNEIASNGVVYVYSRIDEALVFGQSLDYHTYASRDNIAEIDVFGRNMLASNNHLYLSVPQYKNQDDKLGLILDYRRADNQQLWKVHREYSAPVDLEKIKKVMLYNKSKNEIITNLDYIDPIQGKIAGPADEELRYKTPVDPAYYNNSSINNVVLDENRSWGTEQVGRLWWDLTTTKFFNVYQGNLIYKSNNFNTLFPGASVDIYEWVQSSVLPTEWDKRSSENKEGFSGTTKYGSDAYCTRRVYDTIAKRFITYYYFWVKNKTSVPDVQGRSISALTVKNLIEDPAGQKYKFITFKDAQSMVLYNCASLMEDQDIVLNVQYWTTGNKYSNIHNQYQIVTEGLATSVPNDAIRQKLIDSLIGYDSQNRPVPDLNLAPNERYGIFNKPRQGWFVNRQEALKQVIERVNNVLQKTLIVEEKDISKFLDTDPAPSVSTGRYDTAIDNYVDLQFVSIVRAQTAELQPVIQDGKIVRVDIINPGRSYKYAPAYEITGQGSGAELEFSLDVLGQISEVTIKNPGINYNDNTSITVRPFAVLVNADETVNNNWGIYHLINNNWVRVSSQSYDVTAYWNYSDWYAEGYSEFTEIDNVIDFNYNLQSLDDSIGQIVKILNTGGEGWLLLEKINNADTVDYTVNYKTVGKENGTIQLSDTLFNYAQNLVGFDNQTFDTQFFDKQPVQELRLIFEALQSDIFVADLANEFNNLFFLALRYVFTEQGYVDWAFKTSFVKAKHNVGQLRQLVNFKNDSLESYEQYIKEVKPYKTKIREYVSTYDKLENSSNVISDFDAPPRYNNETSKISPIDVRVVNGVLFGTGVLQGADNNWLENASYKIVDIKIADPGEGYTEVPEIIIEGNATAKASIGSNGVISSIIVTDSGSGYTSLPEITINGTLREGGREATLGAVLGDTPVRTMHTIVKFDRVSGAFFITQLNETETFTGTGSRSKFDLKWPMDLRTNTIEIFVDGELVLGSNYTFTNRVDEEETYTRYHGEIEFIDPPANESVIEINYKKWINLLDAQDRINLFYNPTDGQIGKDISQLMDGIDYGGVEVKSFEFGAPPGWDTGEWFTDNWDVYDDNFDDEIFVTDGSTLTFDLAKPLAKDVKYNVYINGVRIDDDEWDGTSTVENPYAIMAPIIGDGVTDTFTFENEIGYRKAAEEIDPGDGNGSFDNPPGITVTIRRSTSDGSRAVSESAYDTAITGGDLAYTTALGINAEDIDIDGDGFVTVTTSKGPEETVPGQIMDTLDITVYERPNSGSGVIEVAAYKSDGITSEYAITQGTFSSDDVIVKLNYEIVDSSQYRVDFDKKTVDFYTAPAAGNDIVIVSVGIGGTDLLDYGETITDGSTQLYETAIPYSEDLTAYVTVNGTELPFTLVDNNGDVGIRFSQTPLADRLLQFAIFNSTVETFSKVAVSTITADGSSLAYELPRTPFEQQPTSYYTIVTVNNERVLTAGYSEVFTVEENVTDYRLKVWQIPVGSTEGTEIKVFLNDRELEFLQEWTYEGAGSFNPNISADAQPGSTIQLNQGIGQPGDELKVFILSSGEYRFGYFDTTNDFIDTSGKQTPAVVTPVIEDGVIVDVIISNPGRGYNSSSGIAATSEVGIGAEFEIEVDEIGRIENIIIVNGGERYDDDTTINIEIVPIPAVIYFDEVFAENDIIKVYQFSNHNGLGIEREKYDILEKTQMTAGTQGYYDSRLLRNGFIDLRSEAISVNYVWVSLNGRWLTPTADYILLENNKTIQLITPVEQYDVVDVMHFAAPPVSTRFGWRQFKDMLNRTTYLRLSRDDEHELAAPLRWYDRSIEVAEGFETLPQPTSTSKYPGVIFIEGERIEFFRREGNILKQLRRGTMGTGVKDEYAAGTYFYNQGLDSVVPYKDEEDRFTVKSGTYTDTSVTYPNSSPDITVDSISYSFNNNTVFPVRVAGVYEQIATVTGTGFRPEVKVLMQDETGNIRELEKVSSTETEIQFHTETMPVGAYDLVIYNPREESPALRQESYLVMPKFLPYVQILVDFSPEAFTDVVQNPTETGEWYKAPFDEGGIPEEYWQALNIEVFANGKRLRKAPITIYDVTKGQGSPDGDIQLEAEYAVNKNEGGYVRLTTPPEPETTLTIVRKLGADWRELDNESSNQFKPLGISNTEVATFLRGKTINLPR